MSDLARWRELGEWWNGEPYREYAHTVDTRGIRRESISDLGPLILPTLGQQPEDTDHSEDWSLRIQKRREEKMALVRLSYGIPEPKKVTWNRRTVAQPYVPLHVLSGYSFGRGTMLPEEAVAFGAMVGCPAMAITDRHSLVGAIEFAHACRRAGIKPLIGAEIELETGGRIVLIARSRRGYRHLSELITACHLNQPRGFPMASWTLLEQHAVDLFCLTGGHVGPLVMPLLRGKDDQASTTLDRLVSVFGEHQVRVEIERTFHPWEISLNRRLADLASSRGVRCIAGGLVTHARPEHAPVQDVIVCIDTLCGIEEVIGRKPLRFPGQPVYETHPERPLNAERHLRTSAELIHLFSDHPEWIQATIDLANCCDDDVLPGRTSLPPLYDDPNHALTEIVEAGAFIRYPKLTHPLRKRIAREIDRIQRLNFASHFLTIWDACRWAEEQDILFSGRGSVVDSVVAYCLGLSRIDAYSHRLHFDRFLPEDGSKRPDIDIDFEAHRREDIRQYLVKRYGNERVATVSAIGAFCTRGIIREVGKVFGLPNSLLGFLSKRIHAGIAPDRLAHAIESRPELRESNIPMERLHWIMTLAERMMDLPRNIRAHSSGVVISQEPLALTVPVMDSGGEADGVPIRIIQWDKRSAKHYFDKFDILCLRGQDVLSGTERRIRLRSPDFNVNVVPVDDPHTYEAMRSGELIGIPQSASPAMRQAHQRIRTNNLHEASLVQAGIRPGVGGAVKLNEMIARRRGKPYSFSHPHLEQILGLTYGIVVFQEQIDQLLQTFAGCTSGEAEDMREQIHKRRREEYGDAIRDDLRRRIRERGYSEPVADEVIDLVAGFKGYGFAQGHALAFAEVSIRSVYCQQNYPSEYFAALLDAQPAGYYGPCTLVNEARSRGVKILTTDVNESELGFQVEDVLASGLWVPNGGLRVGLNQIDGLSEELKMRIVEASLTPQEPEQPDVSTGSSNAVAVMERTATGSMTKRRRFTSFFDFVARIQPERDELEQLILCGAFDSLHQHRRALLWAIPDAIEYTRLVRPIGGLPLSYAEPTLREDLPDFSDIEKALYQRATLGLDVDQHLMAYERERVLRKGGLTTADARRLPDGTAAFVVGNPIRLRFPPTPSGKRVVFFDLEDETGLLNVTCFDRVYRQDGHAIVCSPFVTIVGHAQHRDEHVAFLADRVFPYRPTQAKLPDRPNGFCVG